MDRWSGFTACAGHMAPDLRSAGPVQIAKGRKTLTAGVAWPRPQGGRAEVFGAAAVLGHGMDHMVGKLHQRLREVYIAGKVGLWNTCTSPIRYERRFLQDKFEKPGRERIQFTPEGKRRFLPPCLARRTIRGIPRQEVCRAPKRFEPFDGGESMIPALRSRDQATAAARACAKSSTAWPTAGRLNVLANVMAKPYRVIFPRIFGRASANPDDVRPFGRLKYHLGTLRTDREFDGILGAQSSPCPKPQPPRSGEAPWCWASAVRQQQSPMIWPRKIRCCPC